MVSKNRHIMSPERLKAITDTFYAFAMTLLVLTIDMPALIPPHTDADLVNALSVTLPQIVTYLLSFFLLANFWIVNHREFNFIHAVDTPFLWINLITIVFVVFIPFSTEIVGDYLTLQTANLVFEGNLLALGLCHFGIWEYMHRHSLTRLERTQEQINVMRIRSLSIPFLSVLAMLFTFISPGYSTLIYLLGFFTYRSNHRLHQQTE